PRGQLGRGAGRLPRPRNRGYSAGIVLCGVVGPGRSGHGVGGLAKQKGKRKKEKGKMGPGSKRGNKSPIDSPFLERLFPPCCGSLKWRTPFHGGNRHGLPGYFVRLGHAM